MGGGGGGGGGGVADGQTDRVGGVGWVDGWMDGWIDR